MFFIILPPFINQVQGLYTPTYEQLGLLPASDHASQGARRGQRCGGAASCFVFCDDMSSSSFRHDFLFMGQLH